MNREDIKKLTIEDFMAKKISKDKKANQTKEIYVKSMGGYLTAKMIPDNKIMDLIELVSSDSCYAEIMEFNKQLIYYTIPYLQSQELQTALDIIDPFDVVSLIFEIGEIGALAEEISQFLNIHESVIEIKN